MVFYLTFRFCKKGALSSHHIQFHTDERPYQCTECAERFSTSAMLRSHELRGHGPNAKPLPETTKGPIRTSYLKRCRNVSDNIIMLSK